MTIPSRLSDLVMQPIECKEFPLLRQKVVFLFNQSVTPSSPTGC